MIDPTEIAIGAQVLIAFENQTVSAAPLSFVAPRGYHLLRVTYFTDSELSATSSNCMNPVDEVNSVGDTVTLDLSLSAP